MGQKLQRLGGVVIPRSVVDFRYVDVDSRNLGGDFCRVTARSQPVEGVSGAVEDDFASVERSSVANACGFAPVGARSCILELDSFPVGAPFSAVACDFRAIEGSFGVVGLDSPDRAPRFCENRFDSFHNACDSGAGIRLSADPPRLPAVALPPGASRAYVSHWHQPIRHVPTDFPIGICRRDGRDGLLTRCRPTGARTTG